MPDKFVISRSFKLTIIQRLHTTKVFAKAGRTEAVVQFFSICGHLFGQEKQLSGNYKTSAFISMFNID
jgi:hypothetical protein